MRVAFLLAPLALAAAPVGAAVTVDFADSDATGGGLIWFSPPGYQDVEIVNVGGDHGNVYQATRSTLDTGRVAATFLGPLSFGPAEVISYASSFDVRMIEGAEARIQIGFNETLRFSSTDWTTITLGAPFRAVISLFQSATFEPGGRIFQLDNVVFEQGVVGAPPPVPEPATWAMMIVGFGLAGAALRRRPRAPATAAL